jgi:hypothetical protein
MLPSQTWYAQGPRHAPFGQDVAKFYFVIVVVDRCADLIGKLLEFVEIGIRLRPHCGNSCRSLRSSPHNSFWSGSRGTRSRDQGADEGFPEPKCLDSRERRGRCAAGSGRWSADEGRAALRMDEKSSTSVRLSCRTTMHVRHAEGLSPLGSIQPAGLSKKLEPSPRLLELRL